jgi:aminomethyltransferase
VNRLALVRAVRDGAGLFRALPRGTLFVTGGDRRRWLNGMISNDVERLTQGPTASGCYATLLTPQGRIVADLQVVDRGDAFWLDLAGEALAGVIERLDRYIVADDVSLADRSGEFERMALEGPAAERIFAAAAADAPALAADAGAEVRVAGVPVLVAAFGWTGEPALQVAAPIDRADVVADRLRDAGASLGLVDADFEVLETLRIEAGVPRFGAELDESVLPAEAGLDRAVANDKGCYTGQEVVERLRSQGRVSHHLVGLVTEGDDLFAVGATVTAGDSSVGEVTSACLSPRAGAIALAFVRRAHAEPGARLAVDGRIATVTALPFDAIAPS